jgi:hypothetical protein
VPLARLVCAYPTHTHTCVCAALSVCHSAAFCQELVLAGAGRALCALLRGAAPQLLPAQLSGLDVVTRIAWRSQELQGALVASGVVPVIAALLGRLVAGACGPTHALTHTVCAASPAVVPSRRFRG